MESDLFFLIRKAGSYVCMYFQEEWNSQCPWSRGSWGGRKWRRCFHGGGLGPGHQGPSGCDEDFGFYSAWNNSGFLSRRLMMSLLTFWQWWVWLLRRRWTGKSKGGSKKLTQMLFRGAGDMMAPYPGIEAVEAVNSWHLLKIELIKFADSPDVRQERGVQGDPPVWDEPLKELPSLFFLISWSVLWSLLNEKVMESLRSRLPVSSGEGGPPGVCTWHQAPPPSFALS